MREVQPIRDGSEHLRLSFSEGRPAPPGDAGDSVLSDLRVRNVAQAVVVGGLGKRAELGALIGELLCGGKR